jgi:hypothetical protein
VIRGETLLAVVRPRSHLRPRLLVRKRGTMLTTIRRHWSRISAGILLSGLLGFVAYDHFTEGCCQPGASCCYPGSPCCANDVHAKAAKP